MSSSINGWAVLGLVAIVVLLFVFVTLPAWGAGYYTRRARRWQHQHAPERSAVTVAHANEGPAAAAAIAAVRERPQDEPERELVGAVSRNARH